MKNAAPQRRTDRLPMIPRATYTWRRLFCRGEPRNDDSSSFAQMRTLALVMAGGQGTRLHPLTRDRAKPAVPFGGKYRIIDFVLSNFINSGIYAIYVLVQWRSQSLIEHLKDGWQFGGMLPDHFVIPVPAQMRMGETLVPGDGRCDFSESQSYRRHQAGPGRGLWRGPHLPDGHPADDRVSHGSQGGGHGRDSAGGRGRGESVRDRPGRFGPARFKLRGKARTIRPRCPVRRDARWPRWATTCSIPRCCARR